ncbi:redoxin family protein [Pseudobacteriovorax antillogorgiicola]|uniref:Thiol peroxidase (Atypical 2-Cys peroxiredoxin) n=1 Tax=Pseudobacteriovorax antillogorgiicola TaxID=1513793 RepID=A0A1Y6CMZ1_9BACT|nr:redoxin family protein [Pseudobacteriovorax antillogorgiicola]TCS44814.1 thiol peroxidase (atypical 2-Cys peroxiredoxin) [Pseudobacteriovorax antillogorgiicola]SMF77281.1 thiol peroxidase (atypical 2-Cys peroxiredoxin) [Pseudobacteriovorax antillogorgiicola]
MFRTSLILAAALATGCASTDYSKMPVTKESVASGTSVKRQGQSIPLYKGNLEVGDNINPMLQEIGYPAVNTVSVVSIVPSIDTKVCEAQTHILGESDLLNPAVRKITVSRDTPMAQKRFAEAGKLQNIDYISDFSHGRFGKKSGLLMKGPELLARAVMVTDATGKIVHLQINDDITLMPDMEKAFAVANKLVAK